MPSKATLIILPQLFIGVKCPFQGWWRKSLFRVDNSQPWKKTSEVFFFFFFARMKLVLLVQRFYCCFLNWNFKWSVKDIARVNLTEICCQFNNCNFFCCPVWVPFCAPSSWILLLYYGTHVAFESRNIHLGRCSWIVRKKMFKPWYKLTTIWRLDLIITGTWIRNLILEPYKACCSRYLPSKAAALGRHCTETCLKVSTDSEINVLCCHLYRCDYMAWQKEDLH